MAFDYAVALTGSIATGKSTVVSCFKEEGFEVIDADKIAHEVLAAQHQEIARRFGQELVQDGEVDRKGLGAIVFADERKRKELEALLHPLIYQHIEKRAKELDASKRLYFVDIPLFYETNRYPIKRVLVVYAPPLVQLQRLMLRDGLSKEEAQKRIAMQLPIEEKRQKADYVIDNSGTLTALKHECKRIKEQIVGAFQ